MNNKDQNIEKNIRKKFSDFQAQPSPNVWRVIARKLFWREFLHFIPGIFNIYYTFLILSSLAGSFLLFNNFSSKSSVNFESTKIIPEVEIQDNPQNYNIPINQEPKKQAQNKPIQLNKKSLAANDQSSNLNTVHNTSLRKNKNDEPFKRSEQHNKSTTSATGMMNEKDTLSFQPPAASFRMSTLSGCAPLHVNLENLSLNANAYCWNFGDGTTSTCVNPSYIYEEPGEFTITLTVKNENGDSSLYARHVDVYSSPKARFEMDLNEIPGEGQSVYFYNYSTGAGSFLWNFGDGQTSELRDPIHQYEKEGEYTIILTAISAKGCRDSMILEDALTITGPSLIFPNAFTPNMNGPVGGYFRIKESNNDVFHPYAEEIPVEYHLLIYNKKGNLIFESHEFHIGWDGYYRQELQPQGVYVWKVRGCFGNGKRFVKIGDVTLIWDRK